MNSRLTAQIAFLNEVEKLKLVYRKNKLIDRSRSENTAEHSWHVALMAMVLGEHSDVQGIDLFRVVKMLLVHDLVEIYAGDTWAYDSASEGSRLSREAEAARRLFAMLPADQGKALLGLWSEFEERSTPEGRFAASIDALQPLTNHLLSGSAREDLPVPTRERVLQRKEHIALSSKELWELAQKLIDESVARGLYS